jgi:magnesium-transporting ATPase (P-type)
MGVDAKSYLDKKTDDNIVTEIPFNSKRKRATCVIRHPDLADTVRVFCKGAPEIVLNYVSHYIDESGNSQPFDETKKQNLTENVIIEEFANHALRTILVTYKDYTVAEFEALKAAHNDFEGEADREVLESDLIAVGIFALEDPLRPEVVSAIQKCHKAGITVRMVTGDNIATAKAIAVKAGIIMEHQKKDEDMCMEG